MFGLWKRIAGGAPDKNGADETGAEGRLGAAAILVALARSDDDYAEAEKARILSALRGLFELDAAAAAALLAEAEAAHAAAMDLHRFTLAVKEAYTVDERGVFVEAAWRVVLADEKRDQHENALMRRLAGLLGVEDRVSAEARRRVEAERG